MNKLNFTKNLVLSTFLLAFFFPAWAQVCPYAQLNAFTLHIHTQKSKKKIPGLRVYLLDGYNRPLTNTILIQDGAEGTRIITDTIDFWETPDTSRLADMQRLTGNGLMGAERNYAVTVKSCYNYATAPTSCPIYKALIVDVDGNANGGYFPPKIIYLPYALSVNICATRFHTHLPKGIRNEGGKPYQPIDVVLDEKVKPAKLKVKPHQVYFQPLVDTIKSQRGQDSLYGLRAVLVRDFSTWQIIQSCNMPFPYHYIPAIHFATMIENADFYFDNPAGIPDFRAEYFGEYDEKAGYYNRRHYHYTYDPKTQLYVSDTALNNSMNVFFHGLEKYCGRYRRSREGNVFTGYYEERKNGQWIFRKEEYIPIQTPKPEPLVTYQCVEWIGGESHYRPVYDCSKDEKYQVTLRDTFVFVNHCREAMLFSSDTIPFFRYPKLVQPGDTGIIYFSKVTTVNPKTIIFFEYTGWRQLNDLYGLNPKISIVLVGAETQKTYVNNQIQRVSYPSEDEPFEYELLVHSGGQPKSFGLRRKNSDQQPGAWRFWNEAGIAQNGVINSYRFSLKVRIDSLQYSNDFSVRIKENGAWNEPFSWKDKYSSRAFYVSDKIDSILVFEGPVYNTFKIDVNNPYGNGLSEIFLLKPNEPYIYISNIRYPLAFTNHCYAIEWNWPELRKLKTTITGAPGAEDWLLKKYPELKFFRIFNQLEQKAINLSHLNESRRKTLLEALLADTVIFRLAQIAQLNYSYRTYFHPTITVEFNPGLKEGEARTIAERYGFRYETTAAYGSNSHQFSYRGKMIDEAFLKAINLLAVDPRVKRTFPNWVFPVTHDLKHG